MENCNRRSSAARSHCELRHVCAIEKTHPTRKQNAYVKIEIKRYDTHHNKITTQDNIELSTSAQLEIGFVNAALMIKGCCCFEME